MDLERTTPTDVASVKSALRSVQRRQEIEDTTTAFAFEDDAGHLVKVYVAKDKADDFKQALGAMLDDAERNDLEIAEVIYKLHQSFDIVNVEWCDGSIAEDEEQSSPSDDIENNVDAEIKGFPDNEDPGDVEATDQSDPDDVSSTDDMTADISTSLGGDSDNVQLMNKLLSLLQSKTDAERAKADAEKAKADVEASKVAAQAAQHYASSQEEVLDMDNFNKRQQEDKREATLQSKLIRYRHDLRKETSSSIEDKINDPEFLLNMLSKAVNGRKLGESVMNIAPPTPEEEELLQAEDWENEQRKKKQAEKAREKIMRFRHERKKNADVQSEVEPAREGTEIQGTTPVKSVADLKNTRFLDFLKASGFEAGASHVKANS